MRRSINIVSDSNKGIVSVTKFTDIIIECKIHNNHVRSNT